MSMGKAPRDPLERFAEKIDFGDDCWEWTGAKNQAGYGWVRVGSQLDGSRRMDRAHRVVYELVVGPIPEGTELDHLCRNRACVHPDHLEPVTHAVNTLRGESPFARKARQTHCVHSHEFTPENTYTRPRAEGGRGCRTCMAQYPSVLKKAAV